MAKRPNKASRKPILIVSLVANLGLLFSFKYLTFFNECFRQLLDVFGVEHNLQALHIMLPIGISFYTFQTLSYTIDMYRGKREVENHLGRFALYVSFFPQLIAGPIERSTTLLPQFSQIKTFKWTYISAGTRLIIWGLFKKVVIADSLGPIVDDIFTNYADYPASTLILGVTLFSFQVYGDFSGYSDIAIGTAKLFGIELMSNFKFPNFSRNVAEYWQRWHVSLSTWFRHYIYIPLGGSRVSKLKSVRNIIIIFLVSGFWHGANWTYIIWAVIHVLMYFYDKYLPKFSTLITTQFAVFFAWIFFRSNSVSEASYYIKSIFTNEIYISVSNLFQAIGALNMAFLVVNFFVIFILYKVEDRFKNYSTYSKVTALSIILTYICLFFEKDGGQFIYFQF